MAVRVFLDKSKAELYSQLYTDAQLQEWETSDHNWSGYSRDAYHRVEIRFITIQKENGSYETITPTIDVDVYDKDEHEDWEWDWELEEETYVMSSDCCKDFSYPGTIGLSIKRCYKASQYTKEECIDLVKKIGFDLCTQIECFMVENPNYTILDIRDFCAALFNKQKDDQEQIEGTYPMTTVGSGEPII